MISRIVPYKHWLSAQWGISSKVLNSTMRRLQICNCTFPFEEYNKYTGLGLISL